MQDPLLEGYNNGSLDVDKELLMSFFYKDNREKEGNEMPISFRKMNIDELMKRLNTSKRHGISGDRDEIKKRRQKYGSNLMIPDTKPRKTEDNDYVDINLSREKTIFKYIREHFADRMWKVLLLS